MRDCRFSKPSASAHAGIFIIEAAGMVNIITGLSRREFISGRQENLSK